MSLWKLFRLFLVGFSLVLIIVTSKTGMDLFRSSTIFLLGLIYDYAKIYSAVKDNVYKRNPSDGQVKKILRYFRDQYPKLISYIGLGLISLLLFISLLGVWGVLVSDSNTPELIVIMPDSPVCDLIRFPTNFFRALLMSLWFIVCLEANNPLPRNNQNSSIPC